MPRVPLIRIGEIGAALSRDVTHSVSTAKISYSSTGSSQFDFSVSDPDLQFHNNGYFVLRRQVRFDGVNWEIAAVDVNMNSKGKTSVDVTCRSEAVQKLKRDKGSKNFGAISPTSFASQIAGKFGLDFYGEPSPAKEAITRTQSETQDESSWDVLRRLSSAIEFEMFEAKGVLFFASRENLIAKQRRIEVQWPLVPTAKFPVYDLEMRRSDDDPMGATFSAKFERTNGIELSPGFMVEFLGVPFFEQRFMIDRVEYEVASKKPVQVRGATLEDSSDTGCETKTFKRGSTGNCVRRIQYAMGVRRTGTFDKTLETKVKAFQSANGLSPTGVVDAKTWAKIRAET